MAAVFELDWFPDGEFSVAWRLVEPPHPAVTRSTLSVASAVVVLFIALNPFPRRSPSHDAVTSHPAFR
ncbi:hypothetical protein MGAST_25625 [Mycobacterium gastri 'Wayne']|nr:hypothetical protein MGAST_25625 [Mycobacterium gastri 'Wayne']